MMIATKKDNGGRRREAQRPHGSRVRPGRADRILYFLVGVMMVFLLVAVLYPLIYVVSCSFSSGTAVSYGRVVFWPVDFSLKGYQIVFNYRQVWVGYKNSILYTLAGTMINLCLTTMAAYPLSRREFQGRRFYTLIFMVTMFFSGGMIPTYILMTNLHLTNTPWAVLLSGGISVYNLMIMRTFFQTSIPEDLQDAARIDGITDIGYLFRIVIPLSKAIFAVITLYYAVGHWNSYFNAMLYLRDRTLYPLQLVLRDILNASQVDLSQITDAELLAEMKNVADQMKYSLIVISSLPILVAYPFVQRFFEKGVMIGSIKG